MAINSQHAIRTLRLKVKAEGYARLNKAAMEVNDIWNYTNATSYKAARTAARRGKDALHKFSRRIVNVVYQTIVVGDVSSLKLVKSRMAKSMLDAGWGMLKTYLQYKGQQAGRCVLIVNERNTPRTCSSCKALTGPSGLDMLDVRTWIRRKCGVTHDRDVNAARNILSAGRYPPSVSGNAPLFSVAESGQTYSRREAAIGAMKATARVPDYCCCWAESATSTLASMRSPPPPWRTPRTGAASR